MDGVRLLKEAATAGLQVKVEGDTLRVRGPKKAEPLVKKLLASKEAVIQALYEQRGWDPETASLIRWFMKKGQHLIPTETFQLSPWQRVTRPDVFREAIFFSISIGPRDAHLRHGTITADLRRLRNLLDKGTASQEES